MPKSEPPRREEDRYNEMQVSLATWRLEGIRHMPKTQTSFVKISDEKVQERTGKTWRQWFRIIDALHIEKNGHRFVAMTLSHKHHLNPWWSQAVTIRYEWEHGLRTVKNQRQVTPKHPLFKNPTKKSTRPL